MSKVESYLPGIGSGILVRLGDIIITGDTKWAALSGVDTYDLLTCDGSAVDEGDHPLLYAKMVVLPTISTIEGSPYPYKIVADLT